jgi:hypothetical protein
MSRCVKLGPEVYGRGHFYVSFVDLCVRFYGLTTFTMKSIILWDLVSCNVVRFENIPFKCH